MFSGSFVAMVTPFKDGKLNYDQVAHLIEFHVQNGTSGLVPCGTTGESPTLSHTEHKELVRFVVKETAGRLPVIAGTGSNNTAEAIDLTRAAADAGAQACLVISPYYNRPEPDGMFRHFKAIADAAHLPIVPYNVPSRTGREISLETVLRLADEVEEVVAIKEASGTMDRVSAIKRQTKLDVLSGDDSQTLPIMAIGGSGVISVVANFIPRDVADMVGAMNRGDWQTARELHLKMFPLFKAAFYETNPIPVKTAMAMLGLCGGELRLPLAPMRPENKARLEVALKDYGLLGSGR